MEIDIPDKTLADDDIASGTASSGKVITFASAFKELKGIGISAQNLASGDYYAITNKSATGFTIKFLNSGGSVVNRTLIMLHEVTESYQQEVCMSQNDMVIASKPFLTLGQI